jgi:rSAM/selenodomain-associated transferase 2
MVVSVIIPTLDEADRVAPLISALQADGFEEIVVADGGSTDQTTTHAREAGAIVVGAPRGRGKQLRAGASAATGDCLFFLHADSHPPSGARRLIVETLAAPAVIAGSFCLAFDQRHPLLSFYASCSRLNHSLFTYGDQGLFMTRRAYEQSGGYSDAPLFEDVEIQRRLRRAGRFVKRPEPIVTSARRFLRDGVARREMASIGLLGLYHLGVSPERLERWYRPERRHRQ